MILSSLGIEYEVEGQPPNPRARGLKPPQLSRHHHHQRGHALLFCRQSGDRRLALLRQGGAQRRNDLSGPLEHGQRRRRWPNKSQNGSVWPIPVPVLLFPEGTSTDGAQLLRFHSRLIDPATAAGAPITAAGIRYVIEGGVEERELCWYGDEEFVTHLWKVLGVAGFSAQLRFGEPKIYTDRRVAAEQTHAEITAWRQARALAVQ